MKVVIGLLLLTCTGGYWLWRIGGKLKSAWTDGYISEIDDTRGWSRREAPVRFWLALAVYGLLIGGLVLAWVTLFEMTLDWLWRPAHHS